MNDIRFQLLEKLSSAQGEYVSGGLLSDAMGVSRVSIKKHVDQLVADGYEIQAVRNRGYAVTNVPEHFHELGFQMHCSKRLPEANIVCFDEIDSTSAEVDRMLNAGEQTPIVAVAASQTSGKGRRGNKWESQTGRNLYMSLGFRPEIGATRIGQYTLWIGLCLAEFLRNETDLEVAVKWPNDLYVSGKKLAGILTEAKIDTDRVQHLIMGLGLNVNSELDAFPEELQTKATSLRIELERVLPYNEFVSKVAAVIQECSEKYFEEPLNAVIQEKWADYDFLRNRRVVAKGFRNAVEGVASGIDKEGQLLIKLDNGEIYPVNSGEVTMAFE